MVTAVGAHDPRRRRKDDSTLLGRGFCRIFVLHGPAFPRHRGVRSLMSNDFRSEAGRSQRTANAMCTGLGNKVAGNALWESRWAIDFATAPVSGGRVRISFVFFYFYFSNQKFSLESPRLPTPARHIETCDDVLWCSRPRTVVAEGTARNVKTPPYYVRFNETSISYCYRMNFESERFRTGYVPVFRKPIGGSKRVHTIVRNHF